MKHFLLLPLLLGCINLSFAQQLVPAGGYTLKQEFSAQWIIGGSLVDNSSFQVTENTTFQIPVRLNIDSIDVYPTQCRDFITIVNKTIVTCTLTATISNEAGKTVWKKTIDVAGPYTVDVKSFPSGSYLIYFSSPDDKLFLITKKFIKL